ncbi:MAG: 50S ribosomal protein L1 [bacterium]|nr:50S ribosomal protein L1 [bacterium]
MATRGKRYTEANTKVQRDKLYPLEDAIALLKECATAKFPESIEVHVRLGVDTKKGEEQVRATATLPNGTGKERRVAAFVPDDLIAEAKKAGADIVGNEDVIANIKQTERTDFDVAVAHPSLMPKLAQIAKILGPRGLMPSPKNDTVTPSPGKVIAELKGGKIAFRNDEGGNIHQIVGKVSWETPKLVENITTLLDAIRRAKPPSAKGTYMASVVICSSMGPGIRVAV